MNTFPAYDDRCIKTKTRTYGDKVYTNFRGLNLPEDGVECNSFSHFYWFITCFSQQILLASIFGQFCL